MAEPLGVVASLISLGSLGGKISSSIARLRVGDKANKLNEKIVTKFEIYCYMMELISETVLSSGVVPSGAQMCLKLCDQSVVEILEAIAALDDASKWRSADTLKLEKGLDDFIHAVKLLKDLSDLYI